MEPNRTPSSFRQTSHKQHCPMTLTWLSGADLSVWILASTHISLEWCQSSSFRTHHTPCRWRHLHMLILPFRVTVQKRYLLIVSSTATVGPVPICTEKTAAGSREGPSVQRQTVPIGNCLHGFCCALQRSNFWKWVRNHQLSIQLPSNDGRSHWMFWINTNLSKFLLVLCMQIISLIRSYSRVMDGKFPRASQLSAFFLSSVSHTHTYTHTQPLTARGIFLFCW